jgi:hypothetical protein
VEASEDREEERGRKGERERARDKASELFSRVKLGRAIFSSAGVTTPWKTERAINRQFREAQALTEAEDAEAARLIRMGHVAQGPTRIVGKQ